jgi:plasmid stabilization system protein ParE
MPIADPEKHGVLFSRRASERLAEHALYIFERTGDPDKADRWLDAFRRGIEENLLPFPELGRPVPEFCPRCRKFVFREHTLIYLLKEGTIFILTVYRQNLP